MALIVGGCATLGDNERRPIHSTPTGWPTPADCRIVTSSFGHRGNPGNGRTHFHKGIDVAAPKNTPVHATADGQVAFSGKYGDYGQLVVLDHAEGCQTWYAHLSKRLVKDGRWVRRGETVGLVGKTGRATGYHLHYEVHRGGRPIDPAPLMTAEEPTPAAVAARAD